MFDKHADICGSGNLTLIDLTTLVIPLKFGGVAVKYYTDATVKHAQSPDHIVQCRSARVQTYIPDTKRPFTQLHVHENCQKLTGLEIEMVTNLSLMNINNR